MFSPHLPSLNSYWPFSLIGGGGSTTMSVTYFKRYRMECDLFRRAIEPIQLPRGYRLVPWSANLVDDHAEAKFLSFRGEIDAGIFHALSEPTGCTQLMEGIAAGDGFVPEATWLVETRNDLGERELCGTIQGVRANHRYGGIQNVGVVPRTAGKALGPRSFPPPYLGSSRLGCRERTLR